LKILLTGASGFVGRHLVKVLDGEQIHALSRDVSALPPELTQQKNIQWHSVSLENRAELEQLIQAVRPDRCIHLAWDTQPGRYLDDKAGNLRLLQQSLDLFTLLIAYDCEQILSLGSCAEYAMTGDMLHPQSPLDPQTIYAAAKASLSLLGSQLCKGSKTAFCWARLFYVYGPGEHTGRLMSSLLQKLRDGQDFACGSGTKKKDYLYIRDVVSAIRTLLLAKADGFFNLSSAQAVSIADIGAAAEAAVGTRGLLRYGAIPERPWDPDLVLGDNGDLQRLGWTVAYDLQRGLEDYLKTLEAMR
jgi:nucleoside-diphosphate-sugar epimerase